MSVVEIPIASTAPHFVQDNEVFGTAFHFEFEWVESQEFWMLHIAEENEHPLALGIKLQPDWPLFTHHEAERPFTFMLLARSPGNVLGRQSMNQHFTLVAYEAL